MICSQPRWLVAGLMALAAGTASADTEIPFVFDFSDGNGSRVGSPNSFFEAPSGTSNSDYGHAYEFSTPDVGVTVTAGVINPTDRGGTPSETGTFEGGDEGVYVGQFAGGLGAAFGRDVAGTSDNNNDEHHTVDDKRGIDYLVLQFDQSVWLESLDFDYFRHFTWFNLYLDSIDDSNLLYSSQLDTHIGAYPGGVVTFDMPGFEGSRFIVVPGSNYEPDSYFDSFKLSGATGHLATEIVPTPTAAAGSLALFGLVGARRRKSMR